MENKVLLAWLDTEQGKLVKEFTVSDSEFWEDWVVVLNVPVKWPFGEEDIVKWGKVVFLQRS